MLQLVGHHEIVRTEPLLQGIVDGVHVLIFQLPQEG